MGFFFCTKMYSNRFPGNKIGFEIIFFTPKYGKIFAVLKRFSDVLYNP